MKFDINNYKQYDKEKKNYTLVSFLHGNTLICVCSTNENIILSRFIDNEIMVDFVDTSITLYCDRIEVKK